MPGSCSQEDDSLWPERVALTSHVMKILERLVLAHPKLQVKLSPDPLQFASQPHLGVDSAIICPLLQAHLCLQLDGTGCTVRITFFDLASAFNTIQPLLLGGKPRAMRVDTSTIFEITGYLMGKLLFVCPGNILSKMVESSKGAPQEAVLSPFIFTL